MRQRALVAPGLVAGLALCPAAPGRSTPPDTAAPRADVPGLLDVTLAAGYAFRVVDVAVDDRAHGGAALLAVEPATRWLGFGARLQGLALGFGGGDVLTAPLAFVGGGPALSYAFDDAAVRATAHVGGLIGVVLGGDAAAVVAGASGGLSLRWPLGRVAHVEAGISVPVVVNDARLAGLQAMALLGCGVSVDQLLAGVLAGESPAVLLLPAP
ncbi:MAG: hypothetical protein FJ137_14915 [Deltaproteobacteria bacterium]|nr:hypothetical protein [Deltaproteobacteria bacterium]